MNLLEWKAFFGWMTLLNLALFIFTAMMCIYARGFIERLHGRLFGLRPETIDALLYSFLALYKILVFIFALTPWLVCCILAR